MPKEPDFDLTAAHRFFAADCFNRAWDLLDLAERTPEQERLLVAAAQASLFHWLQRPDCGEQQLSVAHWQLARIHAVLGNALQARREAERCLQHSRHLAPFFLGYAYEALARAARLEGDAEGLGTYLALGQTQAAKVEHEDERAPLLADLSSLAG